MKNSQHSARKKRKNNVATSTVASRQGTNPIAKVINQIFSPTTLEKVTRGFIIAGIASIGMSFVAFVPEMNDYLTKQDPINWPLIIHTGWTVLSSGVVNMFWQWYKGIKAG